MRSLLDREPARTLYLGAHTLARMRPRQLTGIAGRTAREFVVPRVPVDFDRRYDRQVPANPTARTGPVADDTTAIRRSLGADSRERRRARARAAAGGEPVFMNRPARVTDDGCVDWDGPSLDGLPLQWRLKLYGFEPLEDALYGFGPGAVPDDVRVAFDGWLQGWADRADIGEGRYLRGTWTPWAVSLRIQRWLRWLAARRRHGPGDPDVERTARRAIYRNACFLRNHVEWDVDGNHLAENGIALLAAGLAFGERAWTNEGTSVLRTVAREQFLDDGCHYERSPMYHVVVLARLLTAVSLLEGFGRPVPDALQRTAAEATAFLRYLRPPDGDIPLLNDAVHGETLPLEACLRYAEAVGVDDAGTPDRRRGAASGYRWLRNDAGAMFVDGGAPGPPHLPGHSHSDTLSVLLWVDGRPVVTDTGTFDYLAGPRRDYARGVGAHNTVQVGRAEPVPLGGQYLLGPRPDPRTRLRTGEVTLFEGRYDARPLSEAPYTHHRAVYAGDDWWVVDDTVAGDVDGRVRSRLHLHPDVRARRTDEGLRLETGGRAVRLRPLGTTTLRRGEGPYFPRFGEARDRTVVEARAAADGPGRVGVALTAGAGGDPTLPRTDDDGRRLRIGGREHRLPEPRLRPSG